MEAKLKEACSLLREIMDSTGNKSGGACPVCGTYTHKSWCWYPRLLQFFNYPLDRYDLKQLEPPQPRGVCFNPECRSRSTLLVTSDDGMFVICTDCLTRGPRAGDGDEAIRLWNAIPRKGEDYKGKRADPRSHGRSYVLAQRPAASI